MVNCYAIYDFLMQKCMKQRLTLVWCLPVLCEAFTKPCLRTSRTHVFTFVVPSPPTTDTTRLGAGRPQWAVIKV